eukprot:1157305-Pelagomonas_calceolata.AAC.2
MLKSTQPPPGSKGQQPTLQPAPSQTKKKRSFQHNPESDNLVSFYGTGRRGVGLLTYGAHVFAQLTASPASNNLMINTGTMKGTIGVNALIKRKHKVPAAHPWKLQDLLA